MSLVYTIYKYVCVFVCVCVCVCVCVSVYNTVYHLYMCKHIMCMGSSSVPGLTTSMSTKFVSMLLTFLFV